MLVPWVLPKPEPIIVTEEPTPPAAGERSVITGVLPGEPGVKLTLSNVAVARLEFVPALRAKPTYTFVSIVTVALPVSYHVEPSVDR